MKNQAFHMKNQVLFSSQDKSKKKLKCLLLQSVFGALRVENGYLFISAKLILGKR